MPRASRTIPLCALLSLLVACTGDKAGVGIPSGTTTTYVGAFASGTRSGTLSVAISSGSAMASYALPTGISAQVGTGSSSASGTMVFTDGSSATLSGTFTSSTGALSLNGTGGFSLTGTLSGGTLRGTLASSAGTGSWVAYPPAAGGGTSKVLCGTFSGSDAGFWNIVISPSGTVSGVSASIRGGSPVTLSGTLSGSAITLTSSDHGSAQGTLSADGSSISGTWVAPSGSGTFQGGTGTCGTPNPGTAPATTTPSVSGSWATTATSGSGGTSAWVALLQTGSAVSGAGVITTPPLVPISGPSSPAYTGDAYTVTSGSFSASTVTFTASLGSNPAGNGTFLHGTLSFTGTLTGTNTLTGTLTFTPPATLTQTFAAQTVTGFIFTKQ